ncbi:MAG TPA: AMP-binding protein [Bryobacteraceae bacterium]|nr:AMP-binding protein [Bryobacteraceae bacterium]
MSTRPHPRDHRPHLASLVEDFRGYGSQIAVVNRTGVRRQSLTYAGLAELAGRYAAALEVRGIRKGDRVAIWGENGGPWLAAFWGCVLRGAVAVPIDVSGATSFAEGVIREVSPKLVVGGGEKLRLLDGSVPSIAFEHFAETLPREPLLAPAEGLAGRDILQIVFTSGTTGDPKGVVHTHHNLLASFSPIEHEIGKYLKYERPFHPLRLLVTPPLSHVFGQFMGIWIPVLLAAEVHFEPRLVAGDLLATIHRERISVLAAVPRVLEILQSDFELRFPKLSERLSRAEKLPVLQRWWLFRDVHRALGLKFWAVVSGGATLGATLERFWSALGFVIVQGYGMTETAALVSLTHPFHPMPGGKDGYVGKVLPGREVRLGEGGEVLVRGEIVSGATWEGGALRPRESPWLATGDLASIDESGNLRFRGRKKDVIVGASGLNIYPEDLEAALLRQPGVKAAAVAEIEGPRGGEPFAALVMRRAGDPAEAVRAANAELAEYQHIRHWALWPEPDLPRGPTGKVLHRVVAEAVRGMAHEGREIEPNAGTLAGLIGKITGEDVESAADTARLSEDLHLDSLGRVELQSSIETRFGVAFDDAEYQQAKTLGDLKRLLQRPTAGWDATGPATSGRETAETAASEQVTAELGRQVHREEHIYPTWPWSGPIRALRFLFQEAIAGPLVAFLAKPRVACDLASEPTKPLLIVANHVTAFDVSLILLALPRAVPGRIAVAMAAEMLLDWRKGRRQGNVFLNFLGPLQYWLVTGLFNVFPLPRAGNFRASFAHAGRAMDRGFHVLMFPEGQRTPDGKMHAFLGGAGILWKELCADALPVYLGGVAELKMTRSNWFRSGRISVRVGKTIAPEGGDPSTLTRQLEQAVRELGQPQA